MKYIANKISLEICKLHHIMNITILIQLSKYSPNLSPNEIKTVR